MSLSVEPATMARYADVATILAPKKQGAQGCWCLTYRLGQKDNDALKAPHRAEEMERLCRRRVAPGVLAYENGEVVGWAAVGPRDDYEGLPQSRFAAEEDDWALVCFRVRAGHAGKGVARALLDGAVAYARSKGAKAVVAYPVAAGTDRIDRTQASVGMAAWFLDAGFEQVGDTGYRVSGHPRVVVRRAL